MVVGAVTGNRRPTSEIEVTFVTVHHFTLVQLLDNRIGEGNMKKLAKKVQHFLVSEDGPTAVEYAVMLALIVIVCLAAIQAIGTNTAAAFQNVADTIGAEEAPAAP